jgi:general secretion pathway protein M
MISFSLKSLPIKSLSLPFNLQRREKLIVAAAAVCLALFLIAQLIIFPILDRRTRLERQIASQSRALVEMNLLKAEYQKLTHHAQRSTNRVRARGGGFTLFSFLDTLAGKTGIKQNIAYMKPSTTTQKNSPLSLSIVEMKINGLTMEQLVNFLHGIETSPNLVWIKRFTISKDEKEGDLINSVLQVETYQGQ